MLHYERIMYLIEPSELARSAAGKYVLVRETKDGDVVVEFKGVALPARQFVEDARVSQGCERRSPIPTPAPRTGAAFVKFRGWCEERGLSLPALSSPVVAAYFHGLGTRLSAPSTNQHLSAIRQWLEWLTRSGMLRANPAAAVCGARLSREEGRLPRSIARKRAASSRPSRDRMVSSLGATGYPGGHALRLVRVGALVRMRVRDFQAHGGTAWFVLREKGGKERRLPAHHLVREYVGAYLDGAG